MRGGFALETNHNLARSAADAQVVQETSLLTAVCVKMSERGCRRRRLQSGSTHI